ncbi:CDP-alcohol phosphatidyltransferase family protein [Allorhizocola rhizosphaerae]|uniref:CDP-alcohol phosphatidyltransferase family protein n=1 Tax=Allorhizocola rhizosphaerae TaxID=1872709 RepID=UPI000E3C22E8|nr:CDP-alcohol phosphatidyltransferase family protein [Allorhizocola rhizosphaerae]
MPPVRPVPIIGFIGQATGLAALAATTGLGPAGWATGTAYGLVLGVLLAPHRFGPADWVTLARALLVGCVAALTADGFTRPVPVPALVGIAVVALCLDAVDGQIARRSNTASPFGARFDMEVDAFLILVLSVLVAPDVGWWVLTIGAMRYLYVAVSWTQPWMRHRLPPRYWRKVVAAIQGIVLAYAAAGLPVAGPALVVALALLVESFGRDVVWLWRHRARLA